MPLHRLQHKTVCAKYAEKCTKYAGKCKQYANHLHKYHLHKSQKSIKYAFKMQKMCHYLDFNLQNMQKICRNNRNYADMHEPL